MPKITYCTRIQQALYIQQCMWYFLQRTSKKKVPPTPVKKLQIIIYYAIDDPYNLVLTFNTRDMGHNNLT
jgi:hypothetical protein